jgi:hypothetical protein
VRHKLEVIAPESNLPRAWESVITYCGMIECTVVSSNLVTKARDAAPSGSMSLRVSPGDLKKLFNQVEKQGQIVGHATESEDKTTTILDTDARIKNLTTFRDSLRKMVAKPSASVKDIVDIQQQLTDVQTQLDSGTAQRKMKLRRRRWKLPLESREAGRTEVYGHLLEMPCVSLARI